MTSELKDLAAELQKMDAGWPNYAQWDVGLPAGHWRAILALLSAAAPKAPEPQADLVGVLGTALKDADLALAVASERFREYARLHAAKGTPDGDEKAGRNADMAFSLESCRPLDALAAFDAASLVREQDQELRAYGVAEHSPASPGRIAAPSPAGGETLCIACAKPLTEGDRFYADYSGGFIHAECCGPEPESYRGEDGEPLKPGDPIPTPSIWTDEP